MRTFFSLLFLSASVVLLSACDSGGANSDEPETPNYTRATVNRVTIQDMPFTASGGGGWDLTTGPDVYYVAFDGGNTQVASSSGVYTDVSDNELPFVFSDASFTIDNFAEEYQIDLYDLDATTSDDFIGGIVFSLSGTGATTDYPSTVFLSAGGIRMELDVTWSE